MEAKKPIKRAKELQFLSREHHHSLLLAWKIRTGFAKNIEVTRIKHYVDWFYGHHIKPHFEMEEKYIFPILGERHDLIKKAISEHKKLERLFTMEEDIKKSLSLIEVELEQHIRFEERVLFKEIQKNATDKQLKMIDKAHKEDKFMDNKADEFWK